MQASASTLVFDNTLDDFYSRESDITRNVCVAIGRSGRHYFLTTLQGKERKKSNYALAFVVVMTPVQTINKTKIVKPRLLAYLSETSCRCVCQHYALD